MRILILVVALAWTVGAAAQETKVYRWTDEDGVVHFSTTPPATTTPGVEEQMVREAPNPGSVAPTVQVAPPEAESGIDQQAPQLDQIRAQRGQKEQRQLICDRARQRIAAIEPAQRVRIQKSDGTVEWLYGEDRIAELERQRQLARENCSDGRR